MESDAQILGELAALGDSPGKICRSLRDKGIKGLKARCGKCPIANYLMTLGYTNVWAGSDVIFLCGKDPKDSRMLEVKTPTAIIDFMAAFDLGERYSDMVGDMLLTEKCFVSGESGVCIKGTRGCSFHQARKLSEEEVSKLHNEG